MNIGLLGKFMYVTLLYVHMFYIECDLCSMDVLLHAIYFCYRERKFVAWNLVLCIVMVCSFGMLKTCRWCVDSGMLALQNINANFCCGR